MENKKLKKGSKFLSYVLRHDPGAIDLPLDAQGWALVSDLIELTKNRNPRLTRPLIEKIVNSCEKQRFTLNEFGSKIRANQGHSINIDLELKPIKPPAVLYHGTATRYLGEILSRGLVKKNRHHVHLAENKAAATSVGQRHGKVAVLKINAQAMFDNEIYFYQSKNKIWLTDEVPVEYIEVIQ